MLELPNYTFVDGFSHDWKQNRTIVRINVSGYATEVEEALCIASLVVGHQLGHSRISLLELLWYLMISC